MIEFGEQPFKGHCPICGLPLLIDGKCQKYHKIGSKTPKRGRFSGKSKSVNKYNEYND